MTISSNDTIFTAVPASSQFFGLIATNKAEMKKQRKKNERIRMSFEFTFHEKEKKTPSEIILAWCIIY